MRILLIPLLGAVLIAVVVSGLLVSCSSSLPTKPGPDDTMHVVNCVGLAYHWVDYPGDFSLPATGILRIAADSSWATLYIHEDTTGARRYQPPDDTLYLVRDTRWRYAPNDSRHGTSWNPTVILTADSVKIYSDFGDGGTDYVLKKM